MKHDFNTDHTAWLKISFKEQTLLEITIDERLLISLSLWFATAFISYELLFAR